MSFARAKQDRGLSSHTSSIARNIALSHWAGKLAWFIMLDLLLCVAFFVAWVAQGVLSLPEEARQGLTLIPGSSLWVSIPADSGVGLAALANAQMHITDAEGTHHLFEIAPYVPFALCIGGTVLMAEVLELFSGLFEARRIRRMLKPLNELALAAETLSNGQIAHLEQAISAASIETPQVTTGDKDLRSIEIALNNLLRRMQESRAQQARFVSDASHELRTPISVIEGYVRMLDRWGKDDPAVLDESIAALKAESAHMKELVEQLLFLARGDSGRNTLERTTFDLHALVQEVADESQMIDAAHRYEVRQSPDASPGTSSGPGAATTITADRAMVKQALRIIVQNAARYSPEGTRIELSLARDTTSPMIGCAVQDQGIGIPTHDAPHVFERFYRADDARAEHKDGTGLGLSIAKWIIDAHGGTIDVLSREGLGARFTIWLPQHNMA